MVVLRSRLSTIEERNNLKRVVIYGGLSVVLIVVFIFFGIPSLGKISNFVVDFKKGSQPIKQNGTTPPAPPKLNNLPDNTNKENLEIVGTSEPGASIKLFINDNQETVMVDKDGKFSFTFALNKGKNTVSAVAKNTAGNESNASETQTIIYDNLPPDLEITSPTDGTSFYGNLQRQVVIEGKTDQGSKVTINDRIVMVEDDGKFSYATTLAEGDNNFNVKSIDLAGNETTKGITLHYWK